MNSALILASSTATYAGLALVAKYLIDHDREDLGTTPPSSPSLPPPHISGATDDT